MPGLSTNCTIGEYRIEGYLGAGGMGEVYCAQHARLGRKAAVKILTHGSGSEESLERFFNEARIQSSLRHPNIATLYDFTEVEGQPCIIMEYVDGPTLADRIRPSGALDLAETVYVFQAIVEAITYVHENGVVHRDIKSNNIKISSRGEVKLLDFGIAKSEASDRLTATGSVIGTLEYLSPEQIMGGIADARSDIWALGVLLYEMVTGRVPFQAMTIGELCKKIERVDYAPPAVLNPDVPREIATIITRCLRKNPADRYRTARDLLNDSQRLRSITGGIPYDGSVEGGRIGKTVRVALTGLDRRIAAAVAAAIMVLVVGLSIYLMTSNAARPVSKAPEVTPSDEPKVEAANMDPVKKTVTIDVVGGTAKVYRDGNIVGDTPCSIDTRIGETVSVRLVREGFDPLQDSFEVTAQTRIKTYTLQAIEASTSEKADSP